MRSDRQPEFTQIDCEMSFVNQDDVLLVFENLIKNIFKKCIGVELDNFPKIPYWEAIENYGSDKPDTRFDMKIFDCTKNSKGKGLKYWMIVNMFAGLQLIREPYPENKSINTRIGLNNLKLVQKD